MTLSRRGMLNKVSEVTLYFWVRKILCTTVGKTASDYLKAGDSANFALTLPVGHYVLLCNLPGHYAGGMRNDFTVG